LAVLALAGAPACQPTVVTHGHQLDERRVAQIEPGATSREEVARVLGTPSTLATFDDRTWYYISQRYERANFFAQDLVAQDVVAIRFDERGIVADVDRVDLAAAVAVEPDPDATRTLGNELGILEQFVSNIGRFNPQNQGGFARSPGSGIPGGGF
jgi:outer membrane protein assembly factor BamE (lipoprotein component of BamABCDE complex)